METKNIADDLVLTVSDDIEYILVHHKKGSASSGVSVKGTGLELMAMATSVVVNILEDMKEPYIQAIFFKAMFDTIKEHNTLNPIVDVAVSFNGEVLR